MSKQVITFHYELKGEKGEIVDSSKGAEPLSFLEGSHQIIPGLEDVLLLLKKDEAKNVKVPYQDAYGAYDQTLVAQVPRTQFPTEEIKAGDMFQIQKEGMMRTVTVVNVSESMVTIDANHPMAGKDLDFWVQIVERRDATEEELSHGHVHGPHGHAH